MHVRVTGVVIEDDRILLLNQDTDTGRSWSLPGGKVEDGQAQQQAEFRTAPPGSLPCAAGRLQASN
ncbi:MAG TPA: NUDIX domain-containing protein [Streptosporangiaceae bacterium]|nr:NUDIX domain-containing protein [Streptosporangiaceae bacterium]